MGIIDLVFLPIAIVFAIASVIASKRKADIFGVFSFICCIIPPIGSVFDMNRRAAGGDIVGILDIYPTLGFVFVVVFMIVAVINMIRVMKIKR